MFLSQKKLSVDQNALKPDMWRISTSVFLLEEGQEQSVTGANRCTDKVQLKNPVAKTNILV